jgi:hypothetical protein
LFRFLIILLFITSCAEKKKKLPSLKPYSEFIQTATEEVCKKILDCNSNFIRTFPQELAKEITVSGCKNEILKDLDFKLSVQTEKSKQLSKSCFESIINVDCKDFQMISFSEFSCIELNRESKNIYSKSK